MTDMWLLQDNFILMARTIAFLVDLRHHRFHTCHLDRNPLSTSPSAPRLTAHLSVSSQRASPSPHEFSPQSLQRASSNPRPRMACVHYSKCQPSAHRSAAYSPSRTAPFPAQQRFSRLNNISTGHSNTSSVISLETYNTSNPPDPNPSTSAVSFQHSDPAPSTSDVAHRNLGSDARGRECRCSR